MSMITLPLRQTVASEVQRIGLKAKGLALLFSNFRQEVARDDDEDAYAGIGVILEDLYDRSRRLSEFLDCHSKDMEMEVAIDWTEPDPFGAMIQRLKADREAAKAKK